MLISVWFKYFYVTLPFLVKLLYSIMLQVLRDIMDVGKHFEMLVWKIFLKVWNCVAVFLKNTEHSWNQVILLFYLVSIVINNLLDTISYSSLLLLTEGDSLVYRTYKKSDAE